MTFGKWGEETAAEFLKKKGYKIRESNFRCRLGEIDLIAHDGNILVFVEVKTRSNTKFGLPCEAVTELKKSRIRKTIKYYTMINSIDFLDIRIDVVEVQLIEGMIIINHIENIL